MRFGRSVPSIVAIVASLAWTASCGDSRVPPVTTAPSPQLPTPTPTPGPSPQTGFGGAWSGTSDDSQGKVNIAWSLTESGGTVSGSVTTQAVDPNDGSCNSCHRNKSGAVSGTTSGSTLSLTMFFAAGANGDPTPACSATLTASASMLAEGQLKGSYTGSDTCEGPFSNGTLAMTRRP